MSAVPFRSSDGDGRVSVALAELIAQRARVSRATLPPQASHAARSGPQSSRLFGRGMDYAESRVYEPGDDVRRLDWRLTARSGKLHTKLFQEEREGRLLILLDTHACMRFGTRVRFKSVQAARAAAQAAWYAVRAGERVTVMSFGAQHPVPPPRGGARGALAVCGEIAHWDASGMAADEPLSDALRRARRLARGATRILLISDGISCDEAARGHLLELSQHAALRVLIVADALELKSAPAGRYALEHAGERREVTLQAERQREDFRRVLGAGADRLMRLTRALGIPTQQVDTATDTLDSVLGLLTMRRGRA